MEKFMVPFPWMQLFSFWQKLLWREISSMKGNRFPPAQILHVLPILKGNFYTGKIEASIPGMKLATFFVFPEEVTMARQSAHSSQAQNALELLKSDHEQVLQLFSEFEQMENDEEDSDTKRDLVEQACALLSIHAQIEEELFYPALRDVLEEGALIDEAQVEHDIARQLIAEIETMDADEDLYDAKFTVLGEYVKHHIEEEQNEIFPKAKKAKMDLDTLGADLLERKQELMAELGMTMEEEMPAAAHSASKSDKKHKSSRRPHA